MFHKHFSPRRTVSGAICVRKNLLTNALANPVQEVTGVRIPSYFSVTLPWRFAKASLVTVDSVRVHM